MSATEKLYESSSSLGNESELSLSLTPRSLVKIIIISVSEQLSKFKKLKRFVHLPKSISALASCTTSVYVNLSKNSFFVCLSGGVPDLRVQRYNKFQYRPNIFQKKFPKT